MTTESVVHHRRAVNGIKMHYAEAGAGPPVVLLHGFPETWYAWRHQIETLRKRYRLIIRTFVAMARRKSPLPATTNAPWQTTFGP